MGRSVASAPSGCMVIFNSYPIGVTIPDQVLLSNAISLGVG